MLTLFYSFFFNPLCLFASFVKLIMQQPFQSQSGPGAAAVAAAAAPQPPASRPRVRARRGQATDPHSIAERVILLSVS